MFLKIRAWDIKNKTMEYINDFYWFEENGVRDWNGEGHYSNYIFMQWSGMNDIEGKPIYLGDMVHNFKSEYDSKMYGVVKFEEGCFEVVWYKGDYEHEWDQFLFEPVQLDEIIVIGNIYENSGLLEVK